MNNNKPCRGDNQIHGNGVKEAIKKTICEKTEKPGAVGSRVLYCSLGLTRVDGAATQYYNTKHTPSLGKHANPLLKMLAAVVNNENKTPRRLKSERLSGRTTWNFVQQLPCGLFSLNHFSNILPPHSNPSLNNRGSESVHNKTSFLTPYACFVPQLILC